MRRGVVRLTASPAEISVENEMDIDHRRELLVREEIVHGDGVGHARRARLVIRVPPAERDER